MTDAIFSIKHRYAERIYSGQKCVELRRTAPKSPIELARNYEDACDDFWLCQDSLLQISSIIDLDFA
jgi:hypothetical protein